jgi:hypothetical protein
LGFEEIRLFIRVERRAEFRSGRDPACAMIDSIANIVVPILFGERISPESSRYIMMIEMQISEKYVLRKRKTKSKAFVLVLPLLLVAWFVGWSLNSLSGSKKGGQ